VKYVRTEIILLLKIEELTQKELSIRNTALLAENILNISKQDNK
jgi:hypothetical protein